MDLLTPILKDSNNNIFSKQGACVLNIDHILTFWGEIVPTSKTERGGPGGEEFLTVFSHFGLCYGFTKHFLDLFESFESIC